MVLGPSARCLGLCEHRQLGNESRAASRRGCNVAAAVELPSWIGRFVRTLVAALAVVFATFGLFVSVVMPYRLWDSLAFGAWSRQIASGDGFWFDTPALFRQRPLFYALQGIAWRSLDDEWVGRIFSLSFAVVLCVAVYVLAARLTDSVAGAAFLPSLALGVVLASSVLATYLAAGMSDVPVAALVAATGAASWRQRPNISRTALVAVLAAAAVLAKPTALLAFAGLLPALVLLRRRRALPSAAAVAAGIALALAYDLWQARRLDISLSDFLTAGNDAYWRERGAAARWDAVARAAWFGSGLRLLVVFGLAHALARAGGLRPRPALAAGAAVGIAWSIAGPVIADGGLGYPFSGSAIGIAAWLALVGSMAAAPFLARTDPVGSRTYAALLVWLTPTAVAWTWQRADETRHLAPAWAPLALIVAGGLASLSLALFRVRPLCAVAPAVALALLAVSNLVSVDGLGGRGWRDLVDLGPSGWSSRSAMENFAYGPFSYELDLARENAASNGRIVSSNGRLTYFFPGRVDVRYARSCSELEGARFFSYLTSGESRDFAEQQGQPLDPLSWLQCTRPRLELVGEQPGIYEAFVVGGAPHREPALADCHLASTPGTGVDAVFASDVTYDAARTLVRRALAVGFTGTKIERTGCSTFRVVVSGFPARRRVQEDFRREAAAVGLRVSFARAVRFPEVSPDVAAVR